MSQEKNELTYLERTLRDFSEWYQAVTFEELRTTVEETVDTDAKKLAYALTEPDRSLRKIAELIEKALDDPDDVPDFTTIGNWQRDWVRRGLMRQISARKREPIFDLENRFAIELPVKLESLLDEDGDG